MNAVRFDGQDYTVVSENGNILQLRKVGVVGGRTKSVNRADCEFVANDAILKEAKEDFTSNDVVVDNVKETTKTDDFVSLDCDTTIANVVTMIRNETKPSMKIAIGKQAIDILGNTFRFVLYASRKCTTHCGMGSKRWQRLISTYNNEYQKFLETSDQVNKFRHLLEWHNDVTKDGKRFELKTIEKYHLMTLIFSMHVTDGEMVVAALGKELALGLSDTQIDEILDGILFAI